MAIAMPSLAGSLLVASPRLRDPNFLRAVVLLLEHTDEGALGVVLNRTTEKTVREVWDAIDADPIDCSQRLNLGGPVRGPLIALHDAESLADKPVLPGLYVSMQRDRIDQLVRRPGGAFRLYTGNSGWGGGQLEGELKQGGWLTGPATAADVFADPETLWRSVTRRIGLSIVLPGANPDQTPADPSLN